MADNNQGQMRIQTAKAIVARGRSIDVPVSGEQITVGLTAEGKPISRMPFRHVTEGKEVELPIREIKSLRKTGYLVDPEAIAPPIGDGPQFGSNEPGQVRAA
jgi:hypothetical protein